MSERSLAIFKAPLYVAWELTHRCNARCLHCYSDSGPEAGGGDELPLTACLDIVDQLADAGVLVLALSGGEPMMRPGWKRIARHAVARGLSVNIGSNGSSITERNADVLAGLGIKSVTISIDSHRREVHDAFRRLPGLYARAILAVRRLVSRGVRVVVGFTPTRMNWKDGPDVVALAASLGAAAVNLSEYVPAGRGTLDLALAPNELREVLETWIALREAYREGLSVMWHDCRVGMLVPPEEKRDYVGCGAGRLVARIMPDGTVTPCVFLPTAIGVLPRRSFARIWRDSQLLAQFRERTGHVSGNCGRCGHLSTCGGCRAVAHAYSHGDPLAGDPHCWIQPDALGDLKQLADGEGLPV